MKYTIDKKERYTVFTLEDEKLDSLNAPKLKSEFIILANQGVVNLVMDLSHVSFVDSSGLSAILSGNRYCNSLGGVFILTGEMSDMVKKLIRISRLDSVLTIIPTVQESIEYVMMNELEKDLNSEEE
jgi:anti-sigma B factor antagonist